MQAELQAQRELLARQDWVCGFCEKVNTGRREKCELCNSDRPALQETKEEVKDDGGGGEGGEGGAAAGQQDALTGQQDADWVARETCCSGSRGSFAVALSLLEAVCAEQLRVRDTQRGDDVVMDVPFLSHPSPNVMMLLCSAAKLCHGAAGGGNRSAAALVAHWRRWLRAAE